MPTLSAWTVRMALLWLALAALVGASILSRGALDLPGLAFFIPAHAEMMLVGWMMQFAFGVAHWILPRTSPPGPLSRPGEGGRRGNVTAVALAIVALNLGLVLVLLGATVAGRCVEAAAAIIFAAQAAPRIRETGWGAAGKDGDLVRLKKRPDLI